ncbi:MAG: hypothetical protein K2H43_05510, partial [Clostridia bacterium]|nr:hypothetical protein [Clostridia bacterium]
EGVRDKTEKKRLIAERALVEITRFRAEALGGEGGLNGISRNDDLRRQKERRYGNRGGWSGDDGRIRRV